MPKLYYTATSCGAANFIAAFVGGVLLETEQVDISTHVTKTTGTDFYTINPKGNVPAIVLDDGTVLNENSATLQFIADQAPGRLAPANGTSERYLLQSALSYISSEVHVAIGGLFYPMSEPVKAAQLEKVAKKLDYCEKTFVGDKKFLIGDSFTVADAYMYIALSWTQYVGVDLTAYPKVKAYFEGIGALEAVKAAHERIATDPATTI